MDKWELRAGAGRTIVNLSARYMGSDLVVLIYNEKAHIGAVAVADYDHKEQRTSVSVITRLGHKDDAVAQKAAHQINKHTQKPVCVIAGIHLDNITEAEIKQLVENSDKLVTMFIQEAGKAWAV